jgi:hypothetical protein
LDYKRRLNNIKSFISKSNLIFIIILVSMLSAPTSLSITEKIEGTAKQNIGINEKTYVFEDNELVHEFVESQTNMIVLDLRNETEFYEHPCDFSVYTPIEYFLCDSCLSALLEPIGNQSIMLFGDDITTSLAGNALFNMGIQQVYFLDTQGTISMKFNTKTTDHQLEQQTTGANTWTLAPYPPRYCRCTMQKPSGIYTGRGGHQYGCSCVIPGDPSYPESIMYLQFDWGDNTTGYSNWVYANERAYASHGWPVAPDPDTRQYTVNVWTWTSYSCARSGTSNSFTVLMSQVTAPSSLDGPKELTKGTPATYTCTAGYDPEDLQVRVEFNWGDGTNTITEEVNPLHQVNSTHIWNYPLKKEFTIKARTVDSDGYTSDWIYKTVKVSIIKSLITYEKSRRLFIELLPSELQEILNILMGGDYL